MALESRVGVLTRSDGAPRKKKINRARKGGIFFARVQWSQ
jgi:hypothetical protein